MLIISKYKDYYDYLSGIWGVDEKIVLDRRESRIPLPSKGKISLIICGRLIEGYYDGKTVIYGEELSKYGKISEKCESYFKDRFYKPNQGKHVSIYEYENSRYSISVNTEIIYDEEKINDKYNCPILLKVSRFNGDFEKFPRLSDFNLASFVPSETIYQWLIDWISSKNTEKENRPDLRSDVLKIMSHGFDKKTSFRPKIK